ncbi:sugar ABC transporter substrate-binding protein [Arthrobacter globiformis]|uniref:sugar ABC transporter substrate-binding protein n=1 Tax=Arthrobacter globiformis TaxID=1665 RepID=UPI00278B7C00|nr:sugar ABC transporter substrate-binding protein [Arthrobacter globiformis]MDQ0864612.1 ABC-type sugar transport system substrate-binding protein [Arthrobacter globiformis]
MQFKPALIACVATAALASTVALSGCSGSASSASNADCEHTYTIGFSHPIGEAEVIKALKSLAKDHATKVGCVELLLDSTTGMKLESQRATVESWVTQKVDAIVLWPVDSTAFAGLQRQAQSQGTKWLTYLTSMDGQNGSVGFDNKLQGQQIAEDVTAWIKKNYPNGGATAAVTTLTTLPPSRPRYELPIKAIEAAGIKVVSEQNCTDQACGLQIAEDALREHPDLRIFVGLSDESAIGAMKAFKNAGVDPSAVYIAGQDGSPEGLAAVKQGGMYRASSAIPMDALAASIVDAAVAAVTGQGEPNQVTPTVLAKADDPKLLADLISNFERKG